MTGNVAGIVNSNILQLNFAYDYLGRRVEKIVSALNGTSFVPQFTNLFVYDGWNLLAVVSFNLGIVQSFAWGKDLSGTMTKHSGVGGLLMANISSTNCFVGYDGNGNVTSLINATDKSLAARYEYSAYGELLRKTGLLATQNPIRFSSKFLDNKSGLIYYGYRYYSSSLGKWIARDTLGENGGINLMMFGLNNAANNIDPDGSVVVTISTAPVTGDWITDTKLGKLFPETFGRIEADMETSGYSSKYTRGVEWGSQEEISAQRAELIKGETLESVDKAAFALGVADTLLHAYERTQDGGADDFVKSANDYYRDIMSGTSAWADLDAVCMAANMTALTGRYESAYVVLDILLQ